MSHKVKVNEKGQSLVELAISLLVILTLLTGAVEFSIALFQFVQLRDSAQEGALYGSLNSDDTTGICNRVMYSSQSPIDMSSTGENMSCGTSSGDDIYISYTGDHCEGNGITITITFDHHIFMPLVGPIIGSDTIPLTASVTDTILTPICP